MVSEKDPKNFRVSGQCVNAISTYRMQFLHSQKSEAMQLMCAEWAKSQSYGKLRNPTARHLQFMKILTRLAKP
jgi:hypothetical protein